jgi:16S rRNA (cytidine1402-2'-O)-methyltransferase
MGVLYLVSTPIGNLEDITLRAKRILGEVEVIACEDTRKTGLLLKKLEIPKKQLLSYYEENELKRIPQIIKLLKEGKKIALVSSAGTPTISDPGFKLVRECVKEKIKVVSIPGASAILTALTASGLPTDKFLFLGYLPKKQGKRKKVLESLPAKTTIVFFESPHRLLRSLGEIKEILGDIEIVVCRELTKIHEEIRREKVSQTIKHFEKEKPKGEFTLVFNYLA